LRYVTALSVPLLSCLGVGFATVAAHRRRWTVYVVAASVAAFQVIPVDAAWHDRGVVSRQLGPYALLRPWQYSAREALKWISGHASPGEKVIVTPHAASAWLTLAPRERAVDVRQLTIFRTPNLVYDSAGMDRTIRDSLHAADWLIISGKHNPQGLRDGLIEELVRPAAGGPGQGQGLVWNGIRMDDVAAVGTLRVLKIVRPGRYPTADAARR
jgi:hypothetical protein